MWSCTPKPILANPTDRQSRCRYCATSWKISADSGASGAGDFTSIRAMNRNTCGTASRTNIHALRHSPTLTPSDSGSCMSRRSRRRAAFEANVVTTAAEADVGSILGVGLPAWTGGALSYIDTLSAARLVADCKEARTLTWAALSRRATLGRSREENNRPFHAPGAQCRLR